MSIKEKTPNIIILMPDEFRGDCINNPKVKTPNIDKIRDDNAATFLNNFSVNPVCGPSRCCTFTGQYVHNGGHRSLYQLLAPHEENIFRLLKNEGYEVIWIGRNDLFYKRSVKHSVFKRVKLLALTMKKIAKAIPFKTLLKVLGKGIKAVLQKKGMNELAGLVDIVSDYYKVNPWPMDHRHRNSFYFGERTKIQAELDSDAAITEKVLDYLSKKK
ncbi:MAG: sulfatase-like hydrolase/transferase, partial [Candidatus Hodarchaeota archaeon]